MTEAKGRFPLAILVATLALVIAAGAGGTSKPGKAGAGAAPGKSCRATLEISRGMSPWAGMTGSAEEERAGRHLKAEAIGSKLEIPAFLEKYRVRGAPLVAIDREGRRVVVNGQFFSDLERADATRLGRREVRVVGKLLGHAIAPRALATFLLESQIVQTYAHLDATLCLVKEEESAASYAALFDGVHRYCTNRCDEEEYRFVVKLDKGSGEISVEGL